MRKLQFILTVLLSLNFTLSFSQVKRDTIERLREVVVRAYLADQPILSLPSSVAVIDSRQLSKQAGISLIPAVNAIPGLRMEERSPGSYRLSIRGSLLRSPFGVRNVKIYMDDFPLTDAGGNTYLNSVDPESVNSMEILKGPDGSLFGANSGGVVLINPNNSRADTPAISAMLKTGSYNLFQERINFQQRAGKHFFQLNQAYQNSDGYRENSALKRHYGQLRYNYNYTPGSQLRFLGLYSDLSYQTPGGLTQLQFDQQPVSSRPATAFLPGAAEQQAAIYNKTFFAGLLNESAITERLSHTIAVFGSKTDFRNPFITNYELRDENTAGVRTFLELTGIPAENLTWKANAGLEWQQTRTDIQNYDNNAGERGAIQSADDILSRQYFYFGRFSANVFSRINLEVAASVNHYRYEFDVPANATGIPGGREFKPQLMPRFALAYLISPNFSWRNSISRGYSPPAVAEIRASDQQINTTLQPESGWNYETGIRLRNRNDRFWLDASVFYYKLQQAIVRRVSADDREFFLNAGGTDQLGLESQVSGWVIAPTQNGFIRGLQFRNSSTFNNFKFRDYFNVADDFSGNKLTGVPDQVIVSSVDVQLPSRLSLFVQHNYTSSIPLNDANTVSAKSYNLLQLKASWRTRINRISNIELFMGGDNLLDEKYSLGNDLNAFGGRFFNAAPLRNYFAGIRADF